MNYFRYCARYVSPHTNQRYGIFIAVWHLVRDKKVSDEDEAAYWKARAWFEANLPIPPFHATGNEERAITWFKECAMDGPIVEKLRIYREIAARYGTEIELISTESPGRIIYEDDHQVGAVQV